MLILALQFSNRLAASHSPPDPDAPEISIVNAVWYRVPPTSLARRRAKECEMTAAHNHLKLGTLVRVTRISNGKSVLVRITDRGITNRAAKIDLCREAAEQLDMIRAGFVRVRLEIIPEPVESSAPETNPVAAP